MSKYTLGLDFGTESARVVLVDMATGENYLYDHLGRGENNVMKVLRSLRREPKGGSGN